jgi:hypothetical protein
MEFDEAPCLKNITRKHIFPKIKWLNKQKFKEYLRLNQKNSAKYNIYPYMDAIDGVENLNNRIYVGKSIPTVPNNGIFFARDYRENKQIFLEVIGTVSRNMDGEWVLEVSHGSTVHKITNDFLVLCLDDPNSFKWIETEYDQVPKYAFQAAIDEFSNEYFFVGRNSVNYQPRYYSEEGWRSFNENVRNVFGKVHIGHRCMYAPLNNLELAFTKYEILCLIPSPSSLKTLCCLEIRKALNHSNVKIKQLNENKNGIKHLPDVLIKFLKYPSYLSVGEFMLKDEKLVSEDDKFEIKIKKNGDLVCQSTGYSLNEQDHNDSEITNLIKQRVDSVWLHRYQVAFYLQNRKVYIARNFFDYLTPDYRLKIKVENNIPGYLIEKV